VDGNSTAIVNSEGNEDPLVYLAACDDAGTVRLLKNSTSSNILHHDSNGVAVVPACCFRPNFNHTGLELASGGTDCKIHLWDAFRPKKPISTFTINQNCIAQGKSQVCNPPFVYSLTWSVDGRYLAAGFGDGTVGVFEVNNRTLVQSHLMIGDDISSVASVVYPSFSASTNNRILCSAGSDGSIVFWDLGKPSDEQWDVNIGDLDSDAELFPLQILRGLYNDEDNETSSSSAVCATDKSMNHNTNHQPGIIFKIPHDQKINWITAAVPSSTTTSKYNDTIFVADTSPDITSYVMPFG